MLSDKLKCESVKETRLLRKRSSTCVNAGRMMSGARVVPSACTQAVSQLHFIASTSSSQAFGFMSKINITYPGFKNQGAFNNETQQLN